MIAAAALGPKARMFDVSQSVGKAHHQRAFRADHHQFNAVFNGKRDKAVYVLGADGHAFRVLCDACIPGCAIQLVDQGRARNRPAQRVFATATAYDKNLHSVFP